MDWGQDNLIHEDPFYDEIEDEEESCWWESGGNEKGNWNGNGSNGNRNGNGNGCTESSQKYSSDAVLLEEIKAHRDNPFNAFILGHHRQILSILSGYTIGVGGEKRTISNSFIEVVQAYLDATTQYKVDRRKGSSHNLFHYFMQHLKNAVNKVNLAEKKQPPPVSTVSLVEDKDGKPYKEPHLKEFTCNPYLEEACNTIERDALIKRKEKLKELCYMVMESHGTKTALKMLGMIRDGERIIIISKETGIDVKVVANIALSCEELGYVG